MFSQIVSKTLLLIICLNSFHIPISFTEGKIQQNGSIEKRDQLNINSKPNPLININRRLLEDGDIDLDYYLLDTEFSDAEESLPGLNLKEDVIYINKANLKDFEKNADKYIEEYEMLIFEEDVEILSFPITIIIASDVEMKSASDTKIKIECPASEEFVFVILNHSIVKISGFELSGCSRDKYGFVNVTEDSQLILENIDLKDLDIEEYNLINCEDSSLNIDNIYFENNTMSDGSSGLFLINCISEIKNSEFNENEGFLSENSNLTESEGATSGNSISAIESNIILKDVKAIGNVIEDSVGHCGFGCFEKCKITIKDFLCHKNIENNISYGGCLYINSSDTTMSNVTMTENVSKLVGGALGIYFGTVKIENSKFTNNSAELRGGSIFINNAPFTIENTEISYNNASFGGGISFVGPVDGNINNTDFKFNRASSNGGAVSLSGYCNLLFDTCDFMSNIAIFGSCFDLNNHSSYYAKDTLYRQNIADYGLIGSITGNSTQDVILENCEISDDNDASSDDSIVYEEYPESSSVSLNDD